MSIRHYREMLEDQRRLSAFREALFETVRAGDTVAEVGSGVGTFSFFAAQAGAGKVYGIETDPVVEVARAIGKTNGFDGRTVFIQGDSGDVELPEHADLLITEDFDPLFLGPYLEDLVIGPRERFLKPGGRIMPVSLDVHLAPVNAPKLYHSIEVTPKKPSRRLGIDFSPLGELTVNNLYTCNLKAENLLGKPAKLLTCQFLSLRREDLTLDKTIRLDVNRGGAIHGLAGWFDARLSRTIRVSNGPDQPPSAWGQTFIPFRIPAKVVRGDRLEVRIRSSRWGQDSIWGWDVRIFAGSGNRRARKPKAEFHQSTFQGFPFSKERFEKRNPEFVPRLTPEGEAARFLLERVDGHRSLQKLGEELCKSFPGLCKDSEQGFRKVLDIVGDRLK